LLQQCYNHIIFKRNNENRIAEAAGQRIYSNTNLCSTRVINNLLDQPDGNEYTFGTIIGQYCTLDDPALVEQYGKLLPLMETSVTIAAASHSYKARFYDLVLRQLLQIRVDRATAEAHNLPNLIPPVQFANPAAVPANLPPNNNPA
jgi:hypothetical protein